YILQKENNPDAEKIRKYMANYLGLALRAVFLGIDPDYIMLMGIFAYAPDSFIEEVKKIIRENIYLACIDDIDIRKDKRDLTVLLNQGGINLVLKSIIENGE
ncbi:MAG: hypothetical protein IKR11_12005, partial [Solobacterium sp.]|nr:hypothetical protein [Solobacterium sp.]